MNATLAIWLILLATFISHCSAHAQDQAPSLPPPIRADLSGNGQPQSYQLKSSPDQSQTLLTTGKDSIPLDQTFTDSQSHEITLTSHRVSGENPREVLVVSAVQEGDFTSSVLFAQIDGKLTKIGFIEAHGELLIPGNGTLISKNWMGFWNKTEKHVFTQDLQLTHIPQEFYTIDVQGTVIKTFPVYQTRNAKKILANTRQGSQFKILLWDPASRTSEREHVSFDNEWYLIQTESGFTGWVQGRHLQSEFATLPWAG
ncbi:hypothetical protein FEM03_21660 [Phragmitibacter flavus]|uniref:SH3 domain-containing protein n=1 Tax=Phragmitibacter flavus TaxID=2576071 RepID=A0A5R8K8N3_9BACT|nr:hypothetical protein [Phragmitibacter flavus]TLD68650.1 hypothetical protein FEM03_21660 [Phragmitibacter flavus]